jgi:hypothetical protein
MTETDLSRRGVFNQGEKLLIVIFNYNHMEKSKRNGLQKIGMCAKPAI